jgi:hypothetical protein
MARSRLPTAIAIGVAVIIAGYLAWQLRAERQAVAQLQERAAALELEQPSMATAAATLPAAVQPEPAPATETTASAPPPVSGKAPAPAAARQQIIVMRPDGTPDPDPTAGTRALIRMFWGDIEKDLGFSAEEMNALVQLVARGDATPAEFDAVTGGRYAQLQERQWAGLADNKITQLRSSLASSTHPLTDQQAGRLSSAMMAESRRTDGEFAAHSKPTEPRALLDYEEQRVRITEASNERLIAAARSYLAPEQVAVMQSSMSTLINSQRRSLQTRRLRVEAGGSGAADPPGTMYVYPPGTTPPGAPPR